ncbi:MAG: ferritin-like domain-containing protein, partial [Bacteroidota bacterium]|nr:ferritin-like domain-containing protein [Bacteroidota bacterium]
LIPMGTDMEGFNIIFEHEYRHVDFLRTTITSMGGKPVQKPSFDFTAGGAFPTVFSNYDVFLAVSQTFEDTGVRAYKGQAANLISNHAVLTAALQIHSVEGRHASYLRQKRSERAMDESIRPWITGSSTAGIGSAVQPNYAGEDNTIQAGINIVGIDGYPISFDDATEAFDEILTMEQVLAIVKPFIV